MSPLSKPLLLATRRRKRRCRRQRSPEYSQVVHPLERRTTRPHADHGVRTQPTLPKRKPRLQPRRGNPPRPRPCIPIQMSSRACANETVQVMLRRSACPDRSPVWITYPRTRLLLPLILATCTATVNRLMARFLSSSQSRICSPPRHHPMQPTTRRRADPAKAKATPCAFADPRETGPAPRS